MGETKEIMWLPFESLSDLKQKVNFIEKAFELRFTLLKLILDSVGIDYVELKDLKTITTVQWDKLPKDKRELVEGFFKDGRFIKSMLKEIGVKQNDELCGQVQESKK